VREQYSAVDRQRREGAENPLVTAIVLAAGASTRFGSPKQLLDWRGQPLLRHVITQTLAAPVSEIIVVLGAHYARIAPVVQGLPVVLARNQHWEAGLRGSVALGLRALRSPADAAIFLLADQPDISPALISQVIAAFAESRAPIVVPRAGEQRGNPVLFARSLFPELMQVRGDQGGRALMQRYRERIHWVAADERALFDIDRPRDLYQWGV
jgi:molybdenum cofactor cytidylyltransferase